MQAQERPRHLAAGYPNLGVSVRGSFGSKSLKVTLTTPLPTFMSPPSLSNWQSTASHELVISKKTRVDACTLLDMIYVGTFPDYHLILIIPCPKWR